VHFATDHQAGLQDLQDWHDKKGLTLIGSRQSEPPLGVSGPGSNDSIKMSETAESFHKTPRNLCVFCVSAVYILFRFLLPQRRSGRRDYAEKFQISCYYLVLSAVGGAPETFS